MIDDKNNCTVTDIYIYIFSYGIFGFLVVRTFKIYTLSNFQVRSTVLLTGVDLLCVTSLGLICLTTGSLYLLTPLNRFAHPRHLPLLAATSLFSASVSLVLGGLSRFVCFKFHT